MLTCIMCLLAKFRRASRERGKAKREAQNVQIRLLDLAQHQPMRPSIIQRVMNGPDEVCAIVQSLSQAKLAQRHPVPERMRFVVVDLLLGAGGGRARGAGAGGGGRGAGGGGGGGAGPGGGGGADRGV